jgi:hypothetical protein
MARDRSVVFWGLLNFQRLSVRRLGSNATPLAGATDKSRTDKVRTVRVTRVPMHPAPRWIFAHLRTDACAKLNFVLLMNDFLKKSGVAKLVDVSIRTIENWTKNGLLPCLKINGVVRYRRADVENALEAFIVKRRAQNPARRK